MYNILLCTKPGCKFKAKEKYSQKYNVAEDEWRQIFILPRTVTKLNILKDLQFQILHRFIATNKYLYTCKLYETPRCSFCQSELETIEHLFFNCHHVRTFWLHFCVWLSHNVINRKISLTEKEIILGYNDGAEGTLVNRYILYAKRYIFQQKLKVNSLDINTFELLATSYNEIDFNDSVF